MKATVTILVLQEAIKKVKCNTLVNSAVIEFKDNQIRIRGSGVETKTGVKKGEATTVGKVDGSMSFDIRYPTNVQESGKIAISNLSDFLTKTESFEKDDIVTATVTGNKLLLYRESPPLPLEYDLAGEKFVPSAWKEQQEIIFNNPVVLKNLKGASKEFPFTAEVIMDSAQLKSFASMANKMGVNKVPLYVKEGKFTAILQAEGSKLSPELKADSVRGEATAIYSRDVIEIFNIGFGLATIRMGTNSLIYVHYELNQQTSDYICAPASKVTVTSTTVPPVITTPVTPPVTTPVAVPAVVAPVVSAATI